MAVDPKIKQKAEDIRSKIFGSEVRESLASGIEAISEDVEATISRQDYVEEQFQNVIDETTDKDVISAPELIAARNGKSNLKTRLDDEHAQVTAQLQQTDGRIEAFNNRVDEIITTPVDGSVTQQEIIDARQGNTSLGENILNIKENFDLKMLNLVKNGQFSSSSFWLTASGSLLSSSDVAKITASGTSEVSRLYQIVDFGNAVPGHKYLVRVKVRVTSADAKNIYVYLKAGETTSSPNLGVQNVVTPTENEWYTASFIADSGSYNGKLQINITQMYESGAVAAGKVMEVTEPMVVDLTQTFGEEPTLSEFNSLVPSWFDGYKTVTTKQLSRFILDKVGSSSSGNGVVLVATSQSRFKSAADYVCDGISDQIEIQNAIDSFPNGGKVILMEGNFWFDATLKIPSNVTLEGMGKANTIINAVDNFAKTAHSALIANKNIMIGDTGIVLRDFMTDIRKNNQGTIYNLANIYLENVTSCTIEHVRAKGSKEAVHGYFGYGVYYGGCAIMLRRASGCKIQSCWVSHADYDNIGLYEGCHDNIVQGNLMENNAYDYWNIDNVSYRGGGVQITSFLGHEISKNNKIINNIIRENTTTQTGGLNVENKGIVLHSAENTLVKGNHIINVNGDGIKVMVHPEHYSENKKSLTGVIITENVIDNVRNAIQEPESCGIRIKGERINATDMLLWGRSIVADNEISNIASAGVMVIQSEEISISNNIIKNTSASGAGRAAILLQGVVVGMINGNIISKTNGLHGIELADYDGTNTQKQMVMSNLLNGAGDIRDISSGVSSNVIANNGVFS